LTLTLRLVTRARERAASWQESLDSAVELAKGCPVLEIGGAVDVYESIAM
jgi:hypothetical protein